jgi:transcriptional regulator with XRE-family HTH domain
MIKKTNPKELLLFKNIGVFMKETRLENKKTQSYVAKLLNCTFQQVQKYEKASNFIGLFKLETFCERFGKDIGKVVSDAKDNLFLPEQLIEEGKIKVTSVSIKDIANDPTHRLDAIHWLNKKDEQ